jgi:hypothetical protein
MEPNANFFVALLGAGIASYTSIASQTILTYMTCADDHKPFTQSESWIWVRVTNLKDIKQNFRRMVLNITVTRR